TPTIISSPATSASTLPAISSSSQFIVSTCINTDSLAANCAGASLYTTNTTLTSSPASYLTAEAKINDIPGVVLLDTGSGLTIINSRHWSLIVDQSIPPTPYDGADIHGPEGSSIRPIGWVEVKINIAGVIIQHKAVLAANFDHLILLGNDVMKTIGLVLDIQANKMWLRSQPDITYSISSDLTNMGRIDIPLLSTQLRTIPPFHIAFIQVNTPSSISSEAWQASVTGVRRHVVAANSLVRIKNQCCL
ncbi:unnamed protein product, partial [Rotaria sordida]